MPTQQSWKESLQEYFASKRIADSIPPRAELSNEQEEQCRIVGGALIQWLKRHGPLLLQEREVLKETMHVEAEPMIVFVSNAPGLVAAREILHRRPPEIVFFFQEEFDAFLAEFPDETFQWHVVYSSSFDELTKEEQARAAKEFPISASEEYWIHRESTTMGRLFGRGGDHLWKWDGTDVHLLEEGFNHWVS